MILFRHSEQSRTQPLLNLKIFIIKHGYIGYRMRRWDKDFDNLAQRNFTFPKGTVRGLKQLAFISTVHSNNSATAIHNRSVYEDVFL